VQGIDTDLFRPVPAADLRRRLRLEGRRVLLFVGFITPRKGLDYLAQAMHMLPADVHLLIVGRWGPNCRPRFLRALGSAAGRVHEIGFVPDEERPCYYSMADVYVSPSLLEDDDLRQRLGQRGRERVLRHFSYRRMAELTLQTYERFLQGGNLR
jgi:glycosyltransferase involved in cell wall biosynthesis